MSKTSGKVNMKHTNKLLVTRRKEKEEDGKGLSRRKRMEEKACE